MDRITISSSGLACMRASGRFVRCRGRFRFVPIQRGIRSLKATTQTIISPNFILLMFTPLPRAVDAIAAAFPSHFMVHSFSSAIRLLNFQLVFFPPSCFSASTLQNFIENKIEYSIERSRSRIPLAASLQSHFSLKRRDKRCHARRSSSVSCAPRSYYFLA